MSNVTNLGTSSGSPPVVNVLALEGNDSVIVSPDIATGIIFVLGDNTQGIDVTNTAPNTETVSAFDATEAQKGVTLLASNAEAINGTVTTKAITPDDLKAKLGLQTINGLAYGMSTNAALNWLAEATDGQIPIGSTGNPPVLSTITSLDGTVTINNGPGSIDLSVAGEVFGTSQTIGAVTADIITFPLGATPGTYSIIANISAFEPTTPAGAQYFVVGAVRTDGATATLIGIPDPTINEDIALIAADCTIVVSANNAIVRATGVALLTIDWKASINTLFVS